MGPQVRRSFFLARCHARHLSPEPRLLYSCIFPPSAECSVHIAFHGCEQTVWDIGERFALETGYNRWAAANNLIILYPQARRTNLNPKGCWDWWGYTGLDFASKLGVQMQAVHRMMEHLV